MTAFTLIPGRCPLGISINHILSVGWASHVADEEGASDTESEAAKLLARRIVSEFAQLTSTHEVTEVEWLREARITALSFGRSISRRKEQWIGDLRRARERRTRKLSRVHESRREGIFLILFWRLLGPIILGSIGWLVAQIIAPIIPQAIGSQTGTNLPSVIFTLSFIFMGRLINYWFTEMQRNSVDSEFRSLCYRADLVYESGKINDFRHHHSVLCAKYRELTGVEYPKEASYFLIMQGDIARRRELERELRLYDKTTLWYLAQVFLFLRKRRGKGLRGVPRALMTRMQEMKIPAV